MVPVETKRLHSQYQKSSVKRLKESLEFFRPFVSLLPYFETFNSFRVRVCRSSRVLGVQGLVITPRRKRGYNTQCYNAQLKGLQNRRKETDVINIVIV